MTKGIDIPAGEPAKTDEPVSPAKEWPQTRTFIRMLLIIVAMATVLWLLHALREVLLLVVLSVFFAYLMAPLVKLVHRPWTIKGRQRTPPRSLTIGAVYLAIFGSIGIALLVLLPKLGEQITQFASQAPAYLTTARGRAQKLSTLYQQYQLPPSVRDSVTNTVTRGIAASEEYVAAELTSAIGWIAYLPWLVLIPVFAFFFLKDAEDFRHSALLLLPKGRLRWRGDEFFEDVNRTLAAYIRSQMMACLIVGVVCTIGFYLLGVPYALALGVMAGILEFIPLAGPLLAAATTVTVTSFHSLSVAIWVLVFLVVLRIVEDYVIYPRLIGRGIHLHPFAIILAVLCGAELAGIAGIFLAIPVAAILSVGYRHWAEHRGSSGLVAELLELKVKPVPAQ